MPVFTVQKYSKGFDSLQRWDIRTLTSLRNLGHKYAAHYINGSYASGKFNPKVITQSDMEKIFTAGLGLILIFEKSATRGVPGSVQQARKNGLADGYEATIDAAYLGYPADATIICAVGDTDTNKSNINQMVAYWDAFHENTPHPTGLYADYDLIEYYKYNNEVACSVQALAHGWSNGRVHPLAHALQKSPMDHRDGNIVLRPLTAYHPNVLAFPTDFYSSKYSIFAPSQGYWGKFPLMLRKPDVKLGVRGDVVKYVQGVLREHIDITLPITGYCGTKTVEAIRKFQYIYSKRTADGDFKGLKVDGWCGSGTFQAIDNIAMGMAWRDP